MHVSIDQCYGELLQKLLDEGQDITTRNSNVKRLTRTSYDITSTPLISLRKTAWKNALFEMEWFLSGRTKLNYLDPKVLSWWEPWKNEENEIKYNYSFQFRHFHGANGEVDQIRYLEDGVRNHPFSRRNVITTWNSSDMLAKDCPITNCHGTLIQTFVNPDNSLDLFMYQRSVDVMVGLPHNLVQYWAFLLYLAHRTGRTPGTFTWMGGDIHLYECHFDLAKRMIERVFECKETPVLKYNPTSEAFKADDFLLEGEYHPIISEKAVMVV